MKNRLAVIVASLAFIVILLGAYLTSDIRPLPGTNGPTGSDPSLAHVHRIGGYIVVALAIGLCMWVRNLAGWLTVVLATAEAMTGALPVLHAILSPALLSAIVAVAVLESETWRTGPRPVETQSGSLKIMGILVPVLVFIQIGLGAAFRHNAMGVISHIMNAFLVILIALIAGVFVVRQFPDHPALRPAALAMLIVAGVQVLLGFAAYLVLLMSEANNMALIVTSVLHVGNGALTLAASVVLAMEMSRNLIKSSGAR
jgi:heme A synthase